MFPRSVVIKEISIIEIIPNLVRKKYIHHFLKWKENAAIILDGMLSVFVVKQSAVSSNFNRSLPTNGDTNTFTNYNLNKVNFTLITRALIHCILRVAVDVVQYVDWVTVL